MCLVLSLFRLQNSYTASQRTNQELEDKLHTLVICLGGQLGGHCAHSIAGGQDLPGECHSALGLGGDGGMEQWWGYCSVLCKSRLS